MATIGKLRMAVCWSFQIASAFCLVGVRSVLVVPRTFYREVSNPSDFSGSVFRGALKQRLQGVPLCNEFSNTKFV